MLGVISAIVLVVGAISSTASVTGVDQGAAERSGKPVLEEQVIEKSDVLSD